MKRSIIPLFLNPLLAACAPPCLLIFPEPVRGAGGCSCMWSAGHRVPRLSAPDPCCPGSCAQSGSEKRGGDEKEEVLKEFCRDLCEEAKAQRTDPVRAQHGLLTLGCCGVVRCHLPRATPPLILLLVQRLN